MTVRGSKLGSVVQPAVRPSLEELINAKRSMLSPTTSVPIGYGDIETDADVRDELYNDNDERIVRMYIVWDNPLNDLELEDVLEHMRETGAAMVQKVEKVEK